MSNKTNVINSMFDFSTNAKEKEAWYFLDTVWKGLEYLCQQVERLEKERIEKTGKNFGYCDFGNQPDDWFVCNHFLWYANAFYNFIGVFQKAFSVSEDLEQDFVNVVTWRNKVSAHTAWVWPKNDNAATQDMSILLFPEFNVQGDGHLEVGGMQIGSSTGGSSCANWRWGLVSTHERLKEIVSKYASAK
jgi:hypothetical protein